MSTLLPSAVLVVLAAGAAASPRQAPDPPARIVAIGDVHGAADGLSAILQAAGLVDAGGRWSGGRAHLIQTGDFTDRGDQVRDTMELLMRLERDAPRAGGRVEVLLGNHEAMHVLRDFRDVSPGAFAAFTDGRSEERRRKAFETHVALAQRTGSPPPGRESWMAAHPPGFVEYAAAFAPSGRYGRWIRERKAASVAAGTLFMHAGLRPDETRSVEAINRAVARDVRDWDTLVDALARARLVAPTSGLQDIVQAAQMETARIARAQQTGTPPGDHVTADFISHLQRVPALRGSTLIDPEGPLWYRGLAAGAGAGEDVVSLLTRLGVRRAVLGHTPQLPGRITTRLDGRIILIDTGMLASRYAGGRPSALELTGAAASAIYTSGREPLPVAAP